jgi:hypothetical protein
MMKGRNGFELQRTHLPSPEAPASAEAAAGQAGAGSGAKLWTALTELTDTVTTLVKPFLHASWRRLMREQFAEYWNWQYLLQACRRAAR